MNFCRLFALECSVQHYEWGARQNNDRRPFIAELLNVSSGELPFAELWIGAHPKCPSRIVLEDGTCLGLDRFIADHPVESLGRITLDAGFRELPFLLKILDSASALSIQAHPDKDLAGRLHASAPNHYPDANHKPEIAIALQELDALCEFRHAADIRNDVARLQPLREFFAPAAAVADNNAWLKQAFATLFLASNDEIARVVANLATDAEVRAAANERDVWFMRIVKQYPGDRGAVCAYFLNIVHLKQGEAVFLAADEPHSYLRGTIVECMASSDNVVRAGLTGKFIDTDVLLQMLTYHTGPPRILAGEIAIDHGTCVYRTSAPEFEVKMLEIKNGQTTMLPADSMPGVLLVLEGTASLNTCGQQICATRGSAWFRPAAAADNIDIKAIGGDVLIVAACPNLLNV